MTTNIQEVTKCNPAENGQPASYVCTCRQCGGEMEAKWQSPLLPGRAGYWYLTCWNACAMNGYTFTSMSYASMDLEPYMTKS
jgi:hypothetical protein